MAVLTGTLGALQFRLARVEHRVFPELRARALGLLDGVEAGLVELGGAAYLLVDHRREPLAPARVEFWEVEGSSEGDLAGLYVLCDARRQASGRLG